MKPPKRINAEKAVKESSHVITDRKTMAKFVSSSYLGPSFLQKKFIPGKSKIYYSLAVYGEEEKQAVVKTLNEGWLGLGKYSNQFESSIAKIIGKKFGIFVNSGSSGTLLALKSLDLPAGSEVITAACTFATTFAAILNNGLVPVVADSELGTYNLDLTNLDRMVSSKTRAIILPHTLGNLNDMKKLKDFCNKHKLFLIEDSCDTLGGKFMDKPTGLFADISVCSFYASHHITAGGSGGMICFDDEKLYARARAYRDWGRFGDDNEDVEERFNYIIDGIPYDRKFIYSVWGYNMKPTEIQAAFGLAQLKKLPSFNKIRKRNFNRLTKILSKWKKYLILPEEVKDSEVYWLAYPITLKDGLNFERLDLLRYLEKNNIQTRLLFTGNILRQPAFKDSPYRVVGSLKNADKIMKDTFVVGIHQGLSVEEIDFIGETVSSFLKSRLKS